MHTIVNYGQAICATKIAYIFETEKIGSLAFIYLVEFEYVFEDREALRERGAVLSRMGTVKCNKAEEGKQKRLS